MARILRGHLTPTKTLPISALEWIMLMNKLYLIRGASGAGKSSLVESLVEMAGGTSDIVGGVGSLSADDLMI